MDLIKRKKEHRNFHRAYNRGAAIFIAEESKQKVKYEKNVAIITNLTRLNIFKYKRVLMTM
jgi:hypothetical protein